MWKSGIGLAAAITLGTVLPAAAQGVYVGPNGAGVEFGAPAHRYYDYDRDYRFHHEPEWRWRDRDYGRWHHDHVIVVPR